MSSEMTLFTEYLTKGRSIFTTKKGFMGLAPDSAQKGDTVAILLGGTTPYVLRQKGDDYEFLRESYVHGIMDGHALQVYEEVGNELQVFSLV